MFRRRPKITGKSISFMKLKKFIPGLMDAIKAFCGFPMIVRLLPMFELVATAMRKGNVLCAPLRAHKFKTTGVKHKQVVSFVSTAEVPAANAQSFSSKTVGDELSNISSTYFHTPISCRSHEQLFELNLCNVGCHTQNESFEAVECVWKLDSLAT